MKTNNEIKQINKIHMVLIPLLLVLLIVLVSINVGASSQDDDSGIVFDDKYTYISLIEDSFSNTVDISKNSVSPSREDNDFPMFVYRVRKGDNFSTIARNHSTNLSTIYSINGIEQDGNRVRPGEKFLILPGKKGLLHKVQKGETIHDISKIYAPHGVTLDEILDENDIKSDDIVKPGENIFIPGAKLTYDEIKQRSNPSWILPIERGSYVTSEFSKWRTIRIRGRKYSGPQKGIDIGNRKRTNTKIYASRSGTVTFVGYKSGYGRIVIISHGKGYETRYAHLSKYIVKKGQRVRQGQYIARMGNTGRSTGPHLHFEVRYKGVAKNPRNYVPSINNLSKH